MTAIRPTVQSKSTFSPLLIKDSTCDTERYKPVLKSDELGNPNISEFIRIYPSKKAAP